MSGFTDRQKQAFLQDHEGSANDLISEILEDAIEYVKTTLDPDDVFDYEQLAEWAQENDFKRPSDEEDEGE